MMDNANSAAYKQENQTSSSYHPEQQPSAKGIETPASICDKYHFIRELGHGSQGKIYLAQRLSDGKKVAIKQLNISSVKTWKEYELFHREAETLSTLQIDGVARFYEAIECLEDDPPCSYIVQEYLNGRSVGELLKTGHRFSLDCIYDIVRQLLSILCHLHTHQPPVIHRDVKPSNILLKSIGVGAYKVYLIDFGAVANPQVQGGGSTVAGTFGFMAPEQMMGKPEAASDIYSLGAVIVNMITGKSPADMPVKDFRLIFEPDMQQMPPALVSTLRAMLEPKVENRLADYKELIQRFDSFRMNKLYEAIGNVSDKPMAVFAAELDTVDSICKTGNIELWQQLEENTPRKVPANYQMIKVHDEYLQKTSSFVEANRVVPIMFSIMIAVIFLALAAYLSNGFLEILENAISLLCMIAGMAAYPILLIFGLAKQNSSSKKRVFRFPIERRDSHLRPLVQKVLTNGRKNIATIVGIRYVMTETEYVETRSINDKVMRCHFDMYAIHNVPRFEVTYKFNPPDDARAEDLIHTFITHVEPEGHYQVGDALPILYYIEKNQREHREFVYSMPFPLPLNDLVHYSDFFSGSTTKY